MNAVTGVNGYGRPVVLRHRYGGDMVRIGDRIVGASWTGYVMAGGHRPPTHPGDSGAVRLLFNDNPAVEAVVTCPAADVYWAPQSQCDI